MIRPPRGKEVLFVSTTVMKHVCSHCGAQLELAVRSYPMGSALLKERFHADVYCCPKCKKIEL